MRLVYLLLPTIAVAAATPALAQDAPAGAPATPPPAAGDFTWSGPYIGANGGDTWDARTRFDDASGELANNNTALTNGLRPLSHSIKDNGFLAGGQLGYNYQVGGFDDRGHALVLGVEADGDYTDLRRTDTLSNTTYLGPLSTPSTTPYTRVNQYYSRLDYLGTVRGRIGFAAGQAMIYGTGGLAYGHLDRQVTFYGPNSSAPYFNGSSNGFKTGFAYGGGVEFALPTHSFLSALNFVHASAITLKAEFLRYHLGNDTLFAPGVGPGAALGGYSSRVHNSGDLARVGINYKF